MPITERQLRLWIGEHVHWSRYFPYWLLQIYRAGIAAGHSSQQLEPLMAQLSQELGEGHPEMLMRTLPDLPIFTAPSPRVGNMMEYVEYYGDNFDTSILLLAENERFAAQLWQILLREAAHIEGFDPAFIERHLELDEGEHANGVEQLTALVDDNRVVDGTKEQFRTLRLAHLRHHFGDQVDTWFTP